MNLRAILFDLGNTLLEYSLQGHWREFLLQRVAEMYPRVCELTKPVAVSLADFTARINEIIGNRARGIEGDGFSWHFVDRLREGLGAVGINADEAMLEQLTDFFYEPIHACTKPYSDTAEVLETLKSRGMRLAIITNAPWDTPARLLRSDLEQWGFADYFEAFICSGEVPWRKPNPKFMFAAADALGVPREECLVVGDTFDKDIVGAANAGMMSVWINRDGAGAPVEGLQPTWIVTSLSQFWELECWT